MNVGEAFLYQAEHEVMIPRLCLGINKSNRLVTSTDNLLEFHSENIGQAAAASDLTLIKRDQ